MKKIFLCLIMLVFATSVHASSINSAAYKTMQYQSYRNNYRSQVNNNVVPYWQRQSNYSTRRNYQNYANYSRYMNNAYSAGNPYRPYYGGYR